MGRLVLVLAIGAVAFVLVPPERVQLSDAPLPNLSNPVAVLAAREARFADITPGAEARIVWVGSPGQRSDLVVVYLHGFSATSEELRPVPDHVAHRLGANLIYARLPGHGRSGGAMADPRAGDWVEDVALMLAMARQIGDRVIVMGTSTGGTLATYAVTDPDMAQALAGLVLISPNYRLRASSARLLEAPLARLWVPWLIGAERGFDPQNAGHARYWTTQYPSSALVTMGTLMRATRQRTTEAAFATATVPVLALLSEQDQVVSPAAIREVWGRYGGPVTLVDLDLPQTGVDPDAHVLAGDILSPEMSAPVTQIILDWVADQTAP